MIAWSCHIIQQNQAILLCFTTGKEMKTQMSSYCLEDNVCNICKPLNYISLWVCQNKRSRQSQQLNGRRARHKNGDCEFKSHSGHLVLEDCLQHMGVQIMQESIRKGWLQFKTIAYVCTFSDTHPTGKQYPEWLSCDLLLQESDLWLRTSLLLHLLSPEHPKKPFEK